MNLSESLLVDKELFSGERSSYENTEKNQNIVFFDLYIMERTRNNTK